jgi:hypothetical protein
MKFIWRTTPDTGVVAAVARQTTAAADLASIDGQDRLADPRTNPAVRGHADQLRDTQHRRALDADHERLLRRHRVADTRAQHAERALQALQAAREASSAARSVLALDQGRTRFMGVALTASLALSAGSAMGVAALAERLGAPGQVGYIAEVGLTGLTTTVILYRSHLAQHGGRLTGWKACVLWLLMVGPLVSSMVANAFGTGPVGVACSVGAAAFSLLSYVIADASAEALRVQAALVSGADELELREIATGDELFTARAELGIEPNLVQSGLSDRSAEAVQAGPEIQTETGLPDRSADPDREPVPDRSETAEPGRNGDRTETGPKTRTQTAKKTAPKKQTRTGPKTRTDVLLVRARALDEAHLEDTGRHISADNLRAKLHIGKTAALELVRQVRFTPIDDETTAEEATG